MWRASLAPGAELAFQDTEHDVGRITLPEERLARCERHDSAQRGKECQLVVVEAREDVEDAELVSQGAQGEHTGRIRPAWRVDHTCRRGVHGRWRVVVVAPAKRSSSASRASAS